MKFTSKQNTNSATRNHPLSGQSSQANAQAVRPPTSGINIVDNQTIQRMSAPQPVVSAPITENKTGLPENLKTGIETLSGYSMSDVKVHYNSTKPAALQAFAYTQGTDIHVSPGRERYLPHEAWHVVQQKQSRVPVTTHFKGNAFNTDAKLEQEASHMGTRAASMGTAVNTSLSHHQPQTSNPQPAQRQAVMPIQMYAPVLYLIHPDRDRVVPWNFVNNSNGWYTDATYGYSYNVDNHQFFNNQNQTVANPLGDIFDEDAAQGDSGGLTDTHFAINYETDNFNRVTRAHGTINLNGTETGRSGIAQIESWQKMWLVHRSLFNGSTEFNGGHIIAHHFGGSPGTHNMVPMEKGYNQSPGNHNSYKDFENSLDNIITNHGPLQIDVRVGYPANDVDGALSDLWSLDTGNQIAAIKADPQAAETVKRLFRVIPNAITLHSLTSGGFVSVNQSGNADHPQNPRLPMKKSIRANYNIQNIYKTSFDARAKDEQGHWSTKTYHPYHKRYGTHKGQNVDQQKDYEHDYMTLYKDMPKPGITRYLPPLRGLAGGVEAYIWMDPMGIFNKFGGTDTNDTVDPLGTNWAYFRKAQELPNANNGHVYKQKIYKKGHLLNALLHGPGTDSRNLIPLTSSANTDMSTNFEEPVKGMAALVDPRKGIFWRVEAQGQVARPLWNLVAAQAANSGQLWQQESNLPCRLLCEAWEGTIFKGEPKKGRLLRRYIVQNKLNGGDNDGELNPTAAGNLANDLAIHMNVPQGNANINTYNVVTYAINSVAYDNGYQLNLGMNYFNAADQQNYIKGIKDRAFDDGFGRQAKPLNPPPAYDDYYNRGLRRLNHLEGEFNLNAGQARAPWEQREYDRGQRMFGQKEAQNLRDLPMNSSQAAREGHAKGINKVGYDHGFANAQGPQSINGDYLRGFRSGQYDRGFDDAFYYQQANPAPDNQYTEGYRDGIYKRGKFDGEDGLPKRINGNQYYNDGYAFGQEDAGYESGRSGTAEFARLQNGDFARGYREGQYERGLSHGEQLRHQEFHWDHQDPYNRGYRQGLEWAGEEDGRYLRRLPHNAPQEYMRAYNRAAGQIGYNDGYNNRWVQARNIPAYMGGFRDGVRDREQEQRDFDAGYNAGRQDNRFFRPYNQRSYEGLQRGQADRQDFNNGLADGRALRDIPFGASNSYRQGYWQGVEERGYDDGYDGNGSRWPNTNSYQRGYWRGIERRGYKDGYDGRRVRWPNSNDYMRGFNNGRDARREEQRRQFQYY